MDTTMSDIKQKIIEANKAYRKGHDMSRQRMCSRAYWEFRNLMKEILWQLENYSDEWEDIIYDLKVFKPKCEELGYCPETYSCGKCPKKEESK